MLNNSFPNLKYMFLFCYMSTQLKSIVLEMFWEKIKLNFVNSILLEMFWEKIKQKISGFDLYVTEIINLLH